MIFKKISGLANFVIIVSAYPVVSMVIVTIRWNVFVMKDGKACFVINVSIFKKKNIFLAEKFKNLTPIKIVKK